MLVRAVDLAQDRELGRAELLHVDGVDQLGDPADVRDALAAAQPLVLATHPFEDQQVDRDVERLEALGREDVLEEAEVALLPQEDLVDGLLGLDLEDVLEVLPAQPAHNHQQLAHQGAVGLLHVEQLLDLVLADVAPADQVVAEELLGVLGRGRHHQPVAEVDLLGVRIALEGEGAGLAAGRDPLQQIRKGMVRRFPLTDTGELPSRAPSAADGTRQGLGGNP